MKDSKIEWTDHTFNAWWGCMKVSAGCKNCYAESLDNRYHKENPHWGPNSTRKMQSEAYWKQPVKWNADAQKAGVNARVFCSSMADVFEGHPDTLESLHRLFDLIVTTPYLTWQLLTKRPENIWKLSKDYFPESGFPSNVWIGTSVENQETAENRIHHLLQVPVAIRFLSMEPLLGTVDLTFIDADKGGSENWCMINCLTGRHRDMGRPCIDVPTIQWVIVGGESGHHARPMHPDWVRLLRDQCNDANVPFFFKQWGEFAPHMDENNPKKISVVHNGFGQDMCKVGKHAAGRLLDGREWNGMPKNLNQPT